MVIFGSLDLWKEYHRIANLRDNLHLISANAIFCEATPIPVSSQPGLANGCEFEKPTLKNSVRRIPVNIASTAQKILVRFLFRSKGAQGSKIIYHLRSL